MSCSDILTKWFGESERAVRTLFENCRQSDRPVILFFDEIDSLCRSRSESEDDSSRRVKNELLLQTEKSSEDNSLYFVATSNVPWQLDAALLRRFQKRVYIPLPDRASVKRMFEIHLAEQIEPEEYRREFEELCVWCEEEGFSGSDVEVACNEALMRPMRELCSSSHFRPLEEGGVTLFVPARAEEEGARHVSMLQGPEIDSIRPRKLSIVRFSIFLFPVI